MERTKDRASTEEFKWQVSIYNFENGMHEIIREGSLHAKTEQSAKRQASQLSGVEGRWIRESPLFSGFTPGNCKATSRVRKTRRLYADRHNPVLWLEKQ